MSTAVPPENEWDRVTGFDFIDRPLDTLRQTPSASLSRRVLYAFVIALGVTFTAFGSIFLQNTGPIPLKWFPDIRPVLLMTSGLFIGLQAAWGNAGRRRLALWGVIVFVLAFHLEEATVHWIAPFPGSITGSRVGLLGTAGSLMALGGVLLMHIEVEAEHLRRDAIRRGGDRRNAAGLVEGLRLAGIQRVIATGAGVAGIGLLIVAGEKLFGDEATGGGYVLLIGAGLLLVLALFMSRQVPK